ncbi:branched-chain amino acid ABC transporter substrate-binding protein [Kribbella deserti]|uniref:Branched-chain amino acid ABC transporter substrate-binding protein n=1 Tax=Kribbella deserti TaxID=1926257 RepID=A0ABV6QKN2_9ACTN
MHQRSVVRVGASLLVASLALTACGSRGGETGGGGDDKKVAKIGMIVPLSGDLAALGLGMRNSAELAIKQANESNAIPGWKLELDAKDDEAKGDVGANAATSVAGDKETVAVIGTLNSGVSEKVQPILSSAKIAQISPANTNPSLTQGPDWKTAPKRTYPGYFRTCTTDAIQGPFAARYLFETAGIKKIATVHDKKTYGQGLVESFSEEYKKLGGVIAVAETVNPDDTDYSAVISKIKPAGVQAVYAGGESPVTGPLANQMKTAGLKIPLMGGDGMFNAKYLELAAKNAEGDLATSVGAPPETLPSAKKYLEDYKAESFKDPYEAYGPYAYDAALAIIEALKVSLKDAADATSARQPTIDALGSVKFDGATGAVSFDQYGDSTAKVLTTYQVKAGKWVAVETKDFAKP